MSDWISVEERLPENSSDVLGMLECGRQTVVNRSYFWCDFDGHVVNVTHWMPLPEPPGEGE